jgi:hypothetical protein
LEFALYFILILLGWFIALSYYRSSVPAKWAISLAPFVLFGLSRVVNAVSPGIIFELLATIRREYLVTAWSAAGSILAFSVILAGLVYLLIRRAPLKD